MIALPDFVVTFFASFANQALIWGWLFILFFVMWIAWETYQFIKRIDYIAAIPWTYLQITVPDESPQTPKAMEQAYDVWGGIHKDPDLIEKFFEGYTLAWYSCELYCSRGRARYIMVVPTVHRKFFEGVLYGQYPNAEIKEVEDYSQELTYKDIEKTFDMFGTEVILETDDIYPVRTYTDYEDALAEDDKFIDPHQALVEAFTTIEEGEQFWLQVLVRPVSAKETKKWSDRGDEKMAALSGQAKEKTPSLLAQLRDFAFALPGELLTVAGGGIVEPKKKEEKKLFRLLNPAEEARIKGILQKVSRNGFRTKIRVIHIAPAGKLHKPNIGKAFGVFKQFNTFNLNSFRPDPATKTNGPNYILKQTRRRFRKRTILLYFQWRDFWGDESGFMMNAEELATLWHFPTKYGKSPSIERATSGLGAAPADLPYA